METQTVFLFSGHIVCLSELPMQRGRS